MVLHLEGGSCASGTTSDDVDELAHECKHSYHYVSDDQNYDFECPDCRSEFSWMSGLLQHAESDACDEGFGKGTPLGGFVHFLRRRIS